MLRHIRQGTVLKVTVLNMFHEVAHANMHHKQHSEVWEKEFVRLLRNHKVSLKALKTHGGLTGPNTKAYINNLEHGAA